MFLAARPASAQELSLGYQFQRFSSTGTSLNVPAGLAADIAVPVYGSLRIVGALDWSRKTETSSGFGSTVETTANYTSFGGGVRWAGPANAGAIPFVHAIVGAMHISGSTTVSGAGQSGGGSASETGGMIDVGGGVAAPMGCRARLLGELDYRRIFAQGEGVNAVRVVVGLQFALK